MTLYLFCGTAAESRRVIGEIAWCRDRALLITLLLSFALLHGQSGKRKALIIGNNKYTSFPKLDQAPINDANAVQQALIAVGFDKSDISVDYDVNYKDFLTALLDFKDRLTSNDSALFYFSGHGFSIDGSDFLAPVNFAFGNSEEAARQNSIALTQIINFLSITKNRVVILDACRTDSPLLKQMANDSSKAPLGALVGIQGTGTLIAYATSEGKASSARSPSGLSFYTQYLVNSLAAHPKDMRTALSNAKDLTISASHQTQVPAIYDETQGSFSLTREIDIQPAVEPSAPIGEVLGLIADVYADDAYAFDKLLSIRGKEPPDQQARINKAIADRKEYARENLAQGQDPGICGSDPSALSADLKSPDRATRKRAIAGCEPFLGSNFGRTDLWLREGVDQKIDLAAPLIMDAALNDRSILVRAQAVNTINIWFRGAPGFPPYAFDLLETGALSEWWKQNKENLDALLLLSRSTLYLGQGWLSVTLYDEMQKVSSHTSAPLKKAFGEILDQMRSAAAKPSANAGSCADAKRHFEDDLPHWAPDDLELQRSENGWLQPLLACPTDLKILPQVADYAAKTHVLSSRYLAVMILNKWAGATLDPFDTKAIQGWWEKHKVQYEIQSH